MACDETVGIVGLCLACFLQAILFAVLQCVFKKKQWKRMCSLWMYISFYIWLIYLLITETSKCTTFHFGRYLAIAMLGISFLVVLIESGFSSELNYLTNSIRDKTVWEYIQRQQFYPPKIFMSVECYRYDHDDRDVWRVVTIPKKTEEFLYGSWVDVSERETQVSCAASAARVKIDSGFLFGDQEIFDDFKRILQVLAENPDLTDFWLSIKISEMKERFLGFVDLRVKPFWMCPLFFWIATLLQLTWPYRWLFRAKTVGIQYTLKKKIYKSATVPNEEGPIDAAIADQVIVSTTEKKTLSALDPLSAVIATRPSPDVSWPFPPSYPTRLEDQVTEPEPDLPPPSYEASTASSPLDLD